MASLNIEEFFKKMSGYAKFVSAKDCDVCKQSPVVEHVCTNANECKEHVPFVFVKEKIENTQPMAMCDVAVDTLVCQLNILYSEFHHCVGAILREDNFNMDALTGFKQPTRDDLVGKFTESDYQLYTQVSKLLDEYLEQYVTCLGDIAYRTHVEYEPTDNVFDPVTSGVYVPLEKVLDAEWYTNPVDMQESELSTYSLLRPYSNKKSQTRFLKLRYDVHYQFVKNLYNSYVMKKLITFSETKKEHFCTLMSNVTFIRYCMAIEALLAEKAQTTDPKEMKRIGEGNTYTETHMQPN